MLNRDGLVTLTKHQQVSRRLIKVKNWDDKKLEEAYTGESNLTF